MSVLTQVQCHLDGAGKPCTVLGYPGDCSVFSRGQKEIHYWSVARFLHNLISDSSTRLVKHPVIWGFCGLLEHQIIRSQFLKAFRFDLVGLMAKILSVYICPFSLHFFLSNVNVIQNQLLFRVFKYMAG